MEIPVTATSSARQSIISSFAATCQKLTATVNGVAADISGVILLALNVTDVARRRSRSVRAFSLFYHYLPLLHLLRKLISSEGKTLIFVSYNNFVSEMIKYYFGYGVKGYLQMPLVANINRVVAS